MVAGKEKEVLLEVGGGGKRISSAFDDRLSMVVVTPPCV